MRRTGLDTAIGVIALLGVAIAGYLVYVHYADLKPFCVSSGGCETVQSSAYADFLGVPVALLGLIGYVLILGSLFIRGEIGRIVTAVLCLSGFGFSVYLTYLELFRIEAICQWCVASATLMTVLMILAIVRLLKGEDEAPEADSPSASLESTE